MNTMALFDCVVVEFEALTLQRDKLLAVNKVLVEALHMSSKYVCGEGSDEEIEQVEEALKLAGELV